MANALTMVRLLVVPAFIYLLATSGGEPSVSAAILFGFASLTDWVDGQIARRTGTVTEFGRLADPLADRMLIGSALIILLVQDRLPRAGLMTVLFRDAFLLAGNYILLRSGVRISVTLLGKAATLVLMGSLFLFILGVEAAEVLFWLGVGLSVISGAHYAATGYRDLRRHRQQAAHSHAHAGVPAGNATSGSDDTAGGLRDTEPPTDGNGRE